jgi:ubiquinone/menaquinone biosynthesis C-methylase UbiE
LSKEKLPGGGWFRSCEFAIAHPLEKAMKNVDTQVASGFGHEWSTFRQGEQELTSTEREKLFSEYFHIFPWTELPSHAVGLDAGCGSGRWSMMVAPRTGHLHVMDASSEALAVAEKNLAFATNVTFHHASVGEIPLDDESLDFAFSLGVLHHVPDTMAAIKNIAAKLKPNAPFLIYLYYALDNRPLVVQSNLAINEHCANCYFEASPSP